MTAGGGPNDGGGGSAAPAVRSVSATELDTVTAYRLWQLRVDVFVVEQECAYRELDGRDLEPSTRHLWVDDGGAPVGYLRILAEPDGSARIGRVCVARGARGRGWADHLMARALAEVGERTCRLDAQAHLASWYSRWGFRTSGPGFVEDGIPHLPMTLDGAPAQA